LSSGKFIGTSYTSNRDDIGQSENSRFANADVDSIRSLKNYHVARINRLIVDYAVVCLGSHCVRASTIRLINNVNRRGSLVSFHVVLPGGGGIHTELHMHTCPVCYNVVNQRRSATVLVTLAEAGRPV